MDLRGPRRGTDTRRAAPERSRTHLIDANEGLTVAVLPTLPIFPAETRARRAGRAGRTARSTWPPEADLVETRSTPQDGGGMVTPGGACLRSEPIVVLGHSGHHRRVEGRRPAPPAHPAAVVARPQASTTVSAARFRLMDPIIAASTATAALPTRTPGSPCRGYQPGVGGHLSLGQDS